MAIYVWIKVLPDGQPTLVNCEPGDFIAILKIKIKEQLFPKFDHVACDEIVVRDANGNIIDPGLEISSFGQSLGISSQLPFLVDTPAPSTIRKFIVSNDVDLKILTDYEHPRKKRFIINY
jgi:hypothetical protein